ncbi:WHG domain-containing protein [Acetobacter sacchari]|uniref:WHG domain-containing protein n=1 Tax=Acetobacter sacchari TaxID=2661687 RepID=A0ABS3LTE6_9PROT|nr:WHG domain-containing protein [Acetobacter sacchari]MBO1359182.1 WHG domain-containing protein [Acetobacter sacchari]
MGRKGRDPEELKTLITNAAESIIVDHGMGACTARAITVRAGCALGSLGYLFGGLDGVILAVNSRTLQDMGASVFAQAQEIAIDVSRDRLKALALAYFHYARDNLNRWEALFALRLRPNEELPPSFLALRDGLIERIVTLFPADIDIPENERPILARTMYEAVHGIVVLGLDRRLGGGPEDVEARIKLLVGRLA